MLKTIPKKILVSGGIVLLCLAAFLAGGIFLSQAQAATTGTPGGSFVKAGVHVLHVQGADIQGTILGSSSTVLPKGSSVTIHTTASTVYQHDGVKGKPVPVTVGSDIAVYGTLNADHSVTAQTITSGNLGGHGGSKDGKGCTAQGVLFSGTVTALQGNTLTVLDGMNGYVFDPHCNALGQGAPLTFTVVTDAQTTVVAEKATSASLNSIQVGTQITVAGTQQGAGKVNATGIKIIQPFAIGQIVSLNGSTFTLQGNIVVHMSASTQVVNKAQPGSSLAVGDLVYVTGSRQSDGSLEADTVACFGLAGQQGK